MKFESNCIITQCGLVFILATALLQGQVYARPPASGEADNSVIAKPSKENVVLAPEKRELEVWLRLRSPTRQKKYTAYEIYTDLMNILDKHGHKTFSYEDLTSDHVQQLVDYKDANSETCSSAESMDEKKATLDEPIYQNKPNLMFYLKHHFKRQEVVCWKTFQVELGSEVNEIPGKMRKVVLKLRQSFAGHHPKKNLVDGVDLKSGDFTRAIATFMSTFGNDAVKDHQWTDTPADEASFTKNFKKFLFSPCRTTRDSITRFLDYYDQLTVGKKKLQRRARKMMNKRSKKWLASGRICSALLDIEEDDEKSPNIHEIYKAYLAFKSSPQQPPADPAEPSDKKDDDDDEDDDDDDDDNDDTDKGHGDGDEDAEEGGQEEEEEEDDDDDDLTSPVPESVVTKPEVNNIKEKTANEDQNEDDYDYYDDDDDEDKNYPTEEHEHDQEDGDDGGEEEEVEEGGEKEGEEEEEDEEEDDYQNLKQPSGQAKKEAAAPEEEDDEYEDYEEPEMDDDDLYDDLDISTGGASAPPRPAGSLSLMSAPKPIFPFKSDIRQQINNAKLKAAQGQ